MITYDEALTANNFEHVSLKNADGTPLRCRRSGKTKTWKRQPGAFRIPVKYGLKQSFYIEWAPTGFDGFGNAADWEVA